MNGIAEYQSNLGFMGLFKNLEVKLPTLNKQILVTNHDFWQHSQKYIIIGGVVTLIGFMVYKIRKILLQQQQQRQYNQKKHIEEFPEQLMSSNQITFFRKIKKHQKSTTHQINTILQTYQTLKCPITHQLIQQPITIGCGHTFQNKALLQHLNRMKSCPLCRQIIMNIDSNETEIVKKKISQFKKRVYQKGAEWVKEHLGEHFWSEFCD